MDVSLLKKFKRVFFMQCIMTFEGPIEELRKMLLLRAPSCQKFLTVYVPTKGSTKTRQPMKLVREISVTILGK